MSSINIKINSLSNANAEVYLESTTNVYTYKGTLTSGKSMDVSVDYYDPVWVLITPTSSSAYVSVTGTASGSYSSSSSSSTDSNLVIILVPTLVGGTFFILLIVFIIVCNIIRRRRLLAAISNANAAMAHSAAPQPKPTPQLYYPPNQNNSYTNASHIPSMINASPQPSFMVPSSQNDQIYILEPVSAHPTEQPIYLQTDPNQGIFMQPQPGAPIQYKYQ